MHSNRPAITGAVLSLVFGLAVLAVVVTAAVWLRRPSSSEPPAPPQPEQLHFAARAVKPTPAPQGYVGSQACAKCHAEIAESYARHPMYRSCGITPGPDDIEAFDERSEFQASDGRRYRVERRDGEIVHHEIMRDGDGNEIYDQAFKIGFFIGSGTRGKSYAIDHEGLLFQSPISWYTNKGGLWDLSPGYRPFNHARFERRIIGQCVLCHAGRSALAEGQENIFTEPVLLEAAIGCERCHGPGQKHIELQESARPPEHDPSIVNPVSLTADRRDAVCNQCHLQGKHRLARYGRQFDDFRPGDRFDDVVAVLVANTGVRADGRTKAVSQVEQMNDSTCFRKSEGRLGCTSCHDPHSHPGHGDTAAFYRSRCLQCHDEHGCSLDLAQRQAPPAEDSCVYCHMPRLSTHDIPHATQTDHRILRIADSEPIALDTSEAPAELVLFDEANTPMPDWEIERAYSLGKLRKFEQQNYGPDAALRAIDASLRAVLEVAPDDTPSWFGLGASAAMRRDMAEARQAWERVLQYEPEHEHALDALAGICHNTGDFETGLRYVDRLLALNPWHARNYTRQAMMLSGFGDWDRALEAGEKAMELDPTDGKARRWLIDAYRQRGDLINSQRHADILRRITESRMPIASGSRDERPSGR